MLLTGTGPALAQSVPDALLRELGLPYPRSGSADRLQAQQVDLSWIGLYKGQITGTRTTELDQAIRLFLQGLGAPRSTSLTRSQRETLAHRAADTRRGAEMLTETLDWTGTRQTLPQGFLTPPEIWGDKNEHLSYSGQDTSQLLVSIESYDFSNTPAGWDKSIRTSFQSDDMQLLAITTQGDFVGAVATGTKDRRREYNIAADRNGRSARLVIRLEEASVPAMRPLIGEIIASFRPFAKPPLSNTEIARRVANGDLPGRDNTGWFRTLIGNGSGSIVSTQGHILTNHHVVEQCTRVTVFGREAFVVGSDVRTDLALVLAPDLAGRDPVRFRQRQAALGSDVFVMGYPKFNITQSLNITEGIISSSVGLYGDRRHMQITAPVQGGNSGGPVLAADGTQVGVVVSKPTAKLIADEGLENIAWIIRSSVAETFLKRFGVNTIGQTSNARIVGQNDRARTWRRFTVRVECHDR